MFTAFDNAFAIGIAQAVDGLEQGGLQRGRRVNK